MPPSPLLPRGGAWPLVGRRDELDQVRRALGGDTPAVVIGGAQGVGKSRLAAEAMADAHAERRSTERVDGATATASIPFGAVAHLHPSVATHGGDPAQLLVSTVDHLAARAARGPLLVVVDDAHLLDEASLALLRRLATDPRPGLGLLLVVRSDDEVPPPIVGLWKDGHAHRFELQPLTRDQVQTLVPEALGGEVDPATLRWFWDHSLGNPLYLRELVVAEIEHGGLRQVGGVWRSRSPGRAAPRLAEVVRARLGALDAAERSALEALVVAGPLRLGTMTAVAGSTAVLSLVARGLLTESDDGHDVKVTLAHPVYGLVVRDGLAPGRARAVRQRVLDVLDGQDRAEPRDVVCLASLRLDQGIGIDGEQLLAASRYAQAAFPRALAERMDVEGGTVREVTAALADDQKEHPSADDLTVAERLARAAWSADPSLEAGLALTTILVARGDAAEAGRLTTELAGRARSSAERARVALAAAALRFWVQGQADEADDVLRAAESATTDRDARSRLRRFRAGIALNVGRITESVRLASELLADDPTEPAATMAAATTAAGLAMGGRPLEAVAMVDRFLPVALRHADAVPEVVGQMVVARIFAARVLGRFDEAEWLGYAAHQAAAEQGSLAGMAMFAGALGQVALDRGRPVTAARRLREADVLLREHDPFGYRPYVLASLAVALAQAGDAGGARAAHDRASAASTQRRFFDSELTLAEAWTHAADGRASAAAGAAGAAAEQARASGAHSFEGAALHAMVRVGPAEPAVDRLRDLAGLTGSPLVEAYADHAEATAHHDGDALDAVSAAVEGLGAQLVAAEAAAQAAAAHERTGRRTDALRSGTRSRVLAESCEGARTPMLRLAARPLGLTRRESEVADLAAQGLTSKVIAERLFVSPRTVESHLYRIFPKLGVTDRDQLVDLLAQPGLGGPPGG
jgi:DNA-binding CsgD family transcriptional regulator